MGPCSTRPHNILGFVVIILSVLFTIIAIFIVKKIVDPLKKLTAASVQLSNGDYDVEIAQSNTHEIKVLSAAFENMTMRLREREELLKRSANYDSLTGLQNTTAYTVWLTDFKKEIESKKPEFGVVFLDLNDLKKTNDKYGHKVGDALIIAAAKIISETFKDCHTFRIGGDEFLVVLQNCKLKNCQKLFEEFNSKCANTFIEEEGEKIPVHISSGFAKCDYSKDSTFIDVFKHADEAMYENKRKSKATSD